METQGKIVKIEWLLLGMTAIYLLVLLGMSRVPPAVPAGVQVRTEQTVPQEQLLPAWEPVDLNTAAAEELAGLPGIGEKLAERILADRAANGPYENVKELTRVEGIGEKKLAQLDGYVTVTGEETHEDFSG